MSVISVRMPTTAVRVRLTEQHARTRMKLRFVFESREHTEPLERRGAFEAFPWSVGKMDAVFAATQTGATQSDRKPQLRAGQRLTAGRGSTKPNPAKETSRWQHGSL